MPTHVNSRQLISKRWDTGSGWPATAPTATVTRVQTYSNDLLKSSNNAPSWSRRHLGAGGGDIGGPFLVVKRTYQDYSSLGEGPLFHFGPTANPLAPGTDHYLTPQFAKRAEFTNAHFPPPAYSSESAMNQLGTKAISRTAPTKPEFDLSVSLGEMMADGFPAAIGLTQTGRERARKSVNAGSEYLNIEFGWKPLLRDVRKFAQAVKSSHDVLDDFHKRSGQPIKRRLTFPIELSFTADADQGLASPLPLLATSCYDGSSAGRLIFSHHWWRKTWFSATYVYYLPPPSAKLSRYAADARRLLGADLTPATLWNLAPWSWAADWVGNMGDVVTNISLLNNDNLAMRGAYIMEHRSETYEYQNSGIKYKSYPGKAQVFRQSFTTETKQRYRATPYGFGLSWDGFTPRQMAILGALAISRR